jgi:heme-degrading monooxygenase HmoA
MAYLFVKHTVNNFNHWKTVYDAMSSTRNNYGSLGSRVMRGAQDPNQVVVLEEYQTLAGARAWAESSELRVAMGHAGVNSTLDIAFLETFS